MGKTHAIDHVCLHLARSRPDVLTLRMSCEFHRTDFEGPFFCSLLIAAGASGEKVDVVRAQPSQACVARGDQMLPGQPCVIRTRAHAKARFAGHKHLVTTVLERLTKYFCGARQKQSGFARHD
jgi:hypothetical protein